MSESSLQRALVAALERVGLEPIRMQSGKVKVARGWMELAPEGTADLFVPLPGGACIWVECKTPVGKLRAAQVRWHARMAALGHTVIVARDVQGAMDIVLHYRYKHMRQGA